MIRLVALAAAMLARLCYGAPQELSVLNLCLFDGHFNGTTGLEQHVCELQKQLRAKGINATLVVNNKSGLSTVCKNRGIEGVIEIDQKAASRIGRRATAQKSLQTLFQEHHFDIIHSNCSAESRFLKDRPLGTKTVFTNHFKKKIQGKAFDVFDGICHINKETLPSIDTMAQHCWLPPMAKEQKVLTRSSSAQEFFAKKFNWALPDDAFVVVMVGNMYRSDPFKDYELVLQGLEKVAHELPIYFVGVGDGPRMKKIKETRDRLKLTDRALFTGFYTEVDELLAYADAFILASKNEGFGLSVVEAALHGLPLMLSKEMMLGQFFAAGSAALTFENSSSDVSKTLWTLYNSPELQESLGTNALRLATEHFSVEAITQRYVDFYVQLLAQPESSDQEFDQSTDQMSQSELHRLVASGVPPDDEYLDDLSDESFE